MQIKSLQIKSYRSRRIDDNTGKVDLTAIKIESIENVTNSSKSQT